MGFLDHTLGRDAAAINGTITALNTYPGHVRDSVTAAYTDPYRRPATITGPVHWNPAREVCFRYDNGTEGRWNVVFDSTWETLRVGQHIDKEPMGGDFCAAHAAPSDEAADDACPAFTANGDRVVPIATAELHANG